MILRFFRWLYRSAVTGRFVSRRYAEEHSETTIRERVMRDEGDSL